MLSGGYDEEKGKVSIFSGRRGSMPSFSEENAMTSIRIGREKGEKMRNSHLSLPSLSGAAGKKADAHYRALEEVIERACREKREIHPILQKNVKAASAVAMREETPTAKGHEEMQKKTRLFPFFC